MYTLKKNLTLALILFSSGTHMDALTSNQFLSTSIFAAIFAPFFTLFSLQTPKRLLAEYHNECIDFLRLKRRRKTLPPLVPKPPLTGTKRYLYYLPIVSYILAFTREEVARTANPGQRLVMETLSITAIIITFMQFGWSPEGAAMVFFILSLIAIAFIDANTKLIPDIFSVTTLWVGLIAASLGTISTPLPTAIWGAIAGYMGPYIISKLVCIRNKRPDAMGYGDFKMLAMLGVWLGPLNTLNTIILSSLLFLLYFVCMQCAGRVSRHSLIPFGPFLSIAAWAVCQSPWFLFSTYLGK